MINPFYEGETVVFVSEKSHRESPRYYPAVGVTGVVRIAAADNTCLVEFERGTTSGDDKWWCRNEDLDHAEGYERSFDIGELDELFL